MYTIKIIMISYMYNNIDEIYEINLKKKKRKKKKKKKKN